MIVRHVKKNKIPSTILFKLVAHSSTEDLIIVVVDWVDEPKPDKGAFFFLPILQFLFHLHIEFLAGGSISLPWPETKGSRWRAVNAAAVPTPILLPANIRVRLWSLRWPHWRREAARERAAHRVHHEREPRRAAHRAPEHASYVRRTFVCWAHIALFGLSDQFQEIVPYVGSSRHDNFHRSPLCKIKAHFWNTFVWQIFGGVLLFEVILDFL